MKGNKHSVNAKGSIVVTALVGVGVGAIITALLTALLASLILDGAVKVTIASVAVFLIRFLSVLIGGLIGASFLKEKYLQAVGIVALGYLLVLLGIGVTLHDGSFQNCISGVASVLLGGSVALFILQRPQRRRHNAAKYSR